MKLFFTSLKLVTEIKKVGLLTLFTFQKPSLFEKKKELINT